MLVHGFQLDRRARYESVDEKREHKRDLVAEGLAHAAVVFEGDQAVGWCQFDGSPRSGRSTSSRRRTTRASSIHRTGGSPALRGPQGPRARRREPRPGRCAGDDRGGRRSTVEAYPERTEGRDVSGAYIYLGTAAMFERRGFVPQRPVAKHHWVMTRTVEANVEERGPQG